MTGRPTAKAGCPQHLIAPLDDDDLRYRVDVLAVDVRDVVTHAGGWMFDLAMAGWDVTVIVYRDDETLPLRILGVNIVELEQYPDDAAARRSPQLLAVAPDLLEQHPDVGMQISEAIESGLAEAVVWGGPPIGTNAHSVGALTHEPSSAARIFKSRALASHNGSHTEPVDSIERFQRLHAHERVRSDADIGCSTVDLAFDTHWRRQTAWAGPDVSSFPDRRGSGSGGVEGVGRSHLNEARHREG